MNSFGKVQRCTEKRSRVVDLSTAIVTLRMHSRRASQRYPWDGRPSPPPSA